MVQAPLMPKATAVWLVDNTALTFEQIAHFCGLHFLEVKGIADGDVAQGIRGLDPITSGKITREEIERGQADPGYVLKAAPPRVQIPAEKQRKRPKYTPLSRRQDRPNAILWCLRNHPELKDSQIIRLIGTTKPTIQAIRDRCHWNSANLEPRDPVILGLCKQMELDKELEKASQDRGCENLENSSVGLEPQQLPQEEQDSSPSAEFHTSEEVLQEKDSFQVREEVIDADRVFAKLQGNS